MTNDTNLTRKTLRTTETTWRRFRSFATAHGLDSEHALSTLLDAASAPQVSESTVAVGGNR